MGRRWDARPALVALALMLVVGWPLAARVGEAFRPDEEAGSREIVAASRPGEIVRPLGLAFQTVRLVGATEAVALPLGVALGFVLFRTDLWGRRGMLGALALAAFVPMPLHATAWLGGFGNAGRSQALGAGPLLVGWSGAAFIHAMASLPWVVAIAGVGFRAVEPELEELAKLDLSPWMVTWRVTLRRGLGPLLAASLAVAVLTAGDMTVTDLLQVRTYAEECYTQYQRGNGPGAAAASLPPLVGLGALILIGAAWLLRSDPERLASASGGAGDWRLGRWRVPVGLAVMASAGQLVALPLYSLIWRAGRVGGRATMGLPPRWTLEGLAGTLRFAVGELWGLGYARPLRSPLLASAILAALGALFAVALGWCLAWLARRPGPWRWVTAATLALTLAVPGPVAGMALVVAYLRWPAVYDSPSIVVLAYALRTLPYALLVLWPAVRALPQEFLDAAELAGHGPWGRIRRVALPLTRPAIVAAWGVAFALSLGELPASVLVVPPGTTLLAVRVWELLHTGVESHLAGVGLVMLGAIGLAGAVAAWALGRAFGPRGGRAS